MQNTVQSNLNTFISVLTECYEHLFNTDDDYKYAAARTTPVQLANKMTIGLKDGTANKDGEGIKSACKKLKIKHTYKAIKEYLNQ